jgi:hypothetical protein
MSLPTLDPLWRTSPDDRDIIRQYARLSASSASLTVVTDQLNGVAKVSPSTVTRVQGMIDEIETLEADHADAVSSGTAHLGNVTSYEGPAPGVKLSKADRQRKLDVIEWDTDLLKIKTTSSGSGSSTAEGVRLARVAELKDRILTAVGLDDASGGDGTFPVYRS